MRSRSRRETPDDSALLVDQPDAEPLPIERVVLDERDHALWRYVERLPARCRQLLSIVAEVARPDYGLVAEALGMPHGSIGPTRGRCLAKLRHLLLSDPMWSSR